MQLLKGIYMLDTNHYDALENNCNVYLIETGESYIIIDCGIDTILPKIFERMDYWGLKKERVSHVLLTHCHFDHANAAKAMQDMGAKIAAGWSDAEGLKLGDNRTGSFLVPAIKIIKCNPDIWFEKETALNIGNLKIDCLHTPGHTLGGMTYRIIQDGKKILFTGDTLFGDGYETGQGAFSSIFSGLGWSGSVDFDRKLYIKSLEKLLDERPDAILPGHRYVSLANAYKWAGSALNYVYENWREPRHGLSVP